MQIPVDIQIDFLWGEQHFQKDEWGAITYIVGGNGTGKSIFAEKLKQQFGENGLKVRYFGADRIANLAGKWDAVGGQFAYDKLSKGLDISSYQEIFCKNPQNLVEQRITPHFLTTDHPNYYEFTTKG